MAEAMKAILKLFVSSFKRIRQRPLLFLAVVGSEALFLIAIIAVSFAAIKTINPHLESIVELISADAGASIAKLAALEVHFKAIKHAVFLFFCVGIVAYMAMSFQSLSISRMIVQKRGFTRFAVRYLVSILCMVPAFVYAYAVTEGIMVFGSSKLWIAAPMVVGAVYFVWKSASVHSIKELFLKYGEMSIIAYALSLAAIGITIYLVYWTVFNASSWLMLFSSGLFAVVLAWTKIFFLEAG